MAKSKDEQTIRAVVKRELKGFKPRRNALIAIALMALAPGGGINPPRKVADVKQVHVETQEERELREKNMRDSIARVERQIADSTLLQNNVTKSREEQKREQKRH